MQSFGESLSSYLNYLETIVPRENLSERINAQFNAARNQATGLQDNFKTQVESDNIKMLETYDALQMAVPLMKVEMLYP